jgi:hypothetical protein
LLGLRAGGIDLGKMGRDFRFEFQDHQRELMHALAGEGLALFKEGRFTLTERGYMICDEIARRLFV